MFAYLQRLLTARSSAAFRQVWKHSLWRRHLLVLDGMEVMGRLVKRGGEPVWNHGEVVKGWWGVVFSYRIAVGSL